MTLEFNYAYYDGILEKKNNTVAHLLVFAKKLASEDEMVVLHEPTMRTITMVEKAILESSDYPTRMELWRSLPKKIQYQTFQRVLGYLEASGKITFNGRTIIYTGVDNEKLRAFIDSCVRVDQ